MSHPVSSITGCFLFPPFLSSQTHFAFTKLVGTHSVFRLYLASGNIVSFYCYCTEKGISVFAMVQSSAILMIKEMLYIFITAQSLYQDLIVLLLIHLIYDAFVVFIWLC